MMLGREMRAPGSPGSSVAHSLPSPVELSTRGRDASFLTQNSSANRLFIAGYPGNVFRHIQPALERISAGRGITWKSHGCAANYIRSRRRGGSLRDSFRRIVDESDHLKRYRILVSTHPGSTLIEPFNRIRSGRNTECRRAVLCHAPNDFGNVNCMRHRTFVILES